MTFEPLSIEGLSTARVTCWSCLSHAVDNEHWTLLGRPLTKCERARCNRDDIEDGQMGWNFPEPLRKTFLPLPFL